MKNVIYTIMVFALIVMLGSFVSFFMYPEQIHVSTFIFVLSAILGTSSLLAVDKT